VLDIVWVSTLLFGFQLKSNKFPLSSKAFCACWLVEIVVTLPPILAWSIRSPRLNVVESITAVSYARNAPPVGYIIDNL
jgi:hypothetical protein